MLARNGGAVAVWASSGLTVPDPQFQMDQALMQTLFAQPSSTTLGDAVLFAKSGIGDQDVRNRKQRVEVARRGSRSNENFHVIPQSDCQQGAAVAASSRGSD